MQALAQINLKPKEPIPVVTGTSREVENATFWVNIFEKAHGPFTPNEVIALIEDGKVHAESLMWRDPWPAWKRLCHSDELLWAWERALICEIETPNFEVDLDCGFVPEGYEFLDEETRSMLVSAQTRATTDVTPPPTTRRAVGTRRQSALPGAGAVIAFGLALAAGSAAWLSQVPTSL